MWAIQTDICALVPWVYRPLFEYTQAAYILYLFWVLHGQTRLLNGASNVRQLVITLNTHLKLLPDVQNTSEIQFSSQSRIDNMDFTLKSVVELA